MLLENNNIIDRRKNRTSREYNTLIIEDVIYFLTNNANLVDSLIVE